MVWIYLVAHAVAFECGSDPWDPFGPEDCAVVTYTPGPNEAVPPTGVVTVITTDGCTDLRATGGGAELVRTELARPNALTAHRVVWKFALSSLPLGQTSLYLRENGEEMEGFPVTVAEGSGGFPTSLPAMRDYTTASELYCADGDCCSGPWTEIVATVSWFLPGASAPGWTARLLDQNEGFFAEFPLGGTAVDQVTTLHGPGDSAPPCVAIALHDPFGQEHMRTHCSDGVHSSGCASAVPPTGSAFAPGLALLVAVSRAGKRRAAADCVARRPPAP